jgi:hypothetical protein
MERSRPHSRAIGIVAALGLAISPILAATGCAPLLATGFYVLQGGNLAPAECDELKNQRVVVVCRPPASHEYRHAGAATSLSNMVSRLLVDNVKGIDVVNPSEVDNWIDESDLGDFRGLAKAVHADRVVYIELNNFELFKGKTLYQGNAQVHVSVYDMQDKRKMLWEEDLGDILYPENSGIPAQDKPPQQFEREFVAIVAERIAEKFYRHDPHSAFAIDALANR